MKMRVQVIVVRGNQVLMAQHHQGDETYWCLPGGGLEPGETPAEGALRELEEECCVQGKLVRQISHYETTPGDETVTFLVEIGSQEPRLGSDPEVAPGNEVLADVRWMKLAEIPERDRAFLWASGLLTIPVFIEEIERWGDETSYPGSNLQSGSR